MVDKFKDNVPGYPGIYVTKDGRIRSNRSKRWLKPSIGSNSKRCGSYKYLRVNVRPSDKDHCTRTKISKLVALAWVPNPKPEEYNVVMHLDNNPLNNYYKNLKWGTMAMNNEQCRLEGRSPVACSGDININRKVSLKQEAEIRIRFRKGRKALIDSLASEYNLSIGGIKKILSKHNITYGT